MKPSTGDELQMYMATTSEAISSMLVREKDKVQRLVYCISQVLCDAEIRHFRIEKVIFAIVTTI